MPTDAALMPTSVDPPKSFALRSVADNLFMLAIVALVIPIGRLVDNEQYVDPYHANVILRIGITITLAVSLQLINGISGQFSLGHAGFMAVGAYLGGYATMAYSPEFSTPVAAIGFYITLATCGLLAALVLFGLFYLIRQSKRIHSTLPGVLLLAMLAWFVVDISNAFTQDTVPSYLIWAKSIGWLAELFNWLIALTQRVAPTVDGWLPLAWLAPISLLVTLIGGGFFAAMVGFVVGLPTLRLRGDYLAIATLGFAAIINVVITNTQALGGAIGMQVPTYFADVEIQTTNAAGETDYTFVPTRFIAPWIFAAAVITTFAVARLARSPKGRAIVAVREDEIAAQATGIDVTHHKVLAFVVGAFFAGVAGSLFAHRDGFVTTGSFELIRSIELVIIVTIGGLGSITGAIIAAIVLTWLPEFLRDPTNWLALLTEPFGIPLNLSPSVTKALVDVGEWRLVIFAFLLIVIMIARGKARGWSIRRRARTTTT